MEAKPLKKMILELLSTNYDKAFDVAEIALALGVIDRRGIRDALDAYQIIRVKDVLQTLMTEKRVEAREFMVRSQRVVYYRLARVVSIRKRNARARRPISRDE